MRGQRKSKQFGTAGHSGVRFRLRCVERRLLRKVVAVETATQMPPRRATSKSVGVGGRSVVAVSVFVSSPFKGRLLLLSRHARASAEGEVVIAEEMQPEK
jgi:hypothetical protein